jgi:hypothetical protein
MVDACDEIPGWLDATVRHYSRTETSNATTGSTSESKRIQHRLSDEG